MKLYIFILLFFSAFCIQNLTSPQYKDHLEFLQNLSQSFIGVSLVGKKQFPIEPQSSEIKGDNECVDFLRFALSPEGGQYLLTLFSLSGKSVNQIGDPELCRDNKETEYVILGVSGAPVRADIGLCAPASCKSQSDFSPLASYVNEMAKNMTGSDTFQLTVRFPYQAKSASLGWGGWSTLTLILIITILGVMGSLVEYTPILNKPQSDPNEKPDKRLNSLGLALFSFSFKNNLSKLFEVSEKGDQDLRILNGIRVISICWVVLGHTFMISMGTRLTNIISALSTLDNWYFALVPGGFFAVDMFFYMSGFLTFYLLTLKMHPKRGWANFPMVYFHRWFRLFTPAVFCILLCNFIFIHLGSGPDYNESWDMGCQKYWWSSLIFINNIVPWNQVSCMSWFWYLANDFEFFLISPIIIFVYCRSRVAGYGLTGAVMLFNFIHVMVMTAKYDLGIMLTLDNPADFMGLTYLKPWSRFSSYGVGGIIGFMYFEYKRDQKASANPEIQNYQASFASKVFLAPKISTLMTYGYFIVGLFMMTFLVFIQYDFYKHQLMINPWSKFSNMLFNGFSRALFVLGLTFIILPTFNNRLTWIKVFLGSDFMVVMGRLTFAVYLMHIPWMIFFFADLRQGYWMSNLSGWTLVLSTVPISFLFAIPFSMYAEVPFMNLEKYFLMPKPAPKKETVSEFKKIEAHERINFTKDSEEKIPMLSDKEMQQ